MSADYPPPLDTLDPAAWAVYADWCDERGVYPEARRVAEALPQWDHRHPGLVLWGQEMGQWPDAYFPVRPGSVIVVVEGEVTDDLGRATHYLWQALEWRESDDQTAGLEGTPADFLGLVEHNPDTAWLYFLAVVEAVRERREQREAFDDIPF